MTHTEALLGRYPLFDKTLANQEISHRSQSSLISQQLEAVVFISGSSLTSTTRYF
ncbi:MULTISPECIES: hypothetical protein [Nostoc]|uniref:Uncharacterized protein n=1 Tax=Nostoc paludosum FACHB-159 TaxID=2692908 RepID=A0ABR8K1X1_9NOSO|nr:MULTISPECIES: hypothetical protein [Nostoc]MBD2676111.1 hypothetical protein [Nostoc sp. FACHB-857]MBD2732759.1 hypothetical protein [Nostoc paludosum FACHB-159]